MTAASLESAPLAQRAQRLFDANRAQCPRCGALLRRMHLEESSLYVTCEERAPDARPGAPAGQTRRCGQHSYLAAHSGGFVLVVAITRDEFAQLAGNITRPADVLAQLGVIERRQHPRGTP